MRMESGALISANVKLRAQLERAKIALGYYAHGMHYEVVDQDGKRRTRLIDSGGVAEDCLEELDR
jgi:hypothetical protein